MSIRYISDHDSPDDPGGLIREVLEMGDAFPGPAEDVVLAWVLRLGQDRDPAEAAKRLIADYYLDREPAPGGACGRLVRLNRSPAECPPPRTPRPPIHAPPPRGRRRPSPHRAPSAPPHHPHPPNT